MPEGPEILLTSQYLTQKIVGHEIKSIKIISGRYTHQKLKGLDIIKNVATVVKINSKGKFMWFELKDTKTNDIIYILNTFGMSGKWSFEKGNGARIKIGMRYKKKKYKLYFHDMCNFGTIQFTSDKKVLDAKLDKLGTDLIKSNYSIKEMEKHLNKVTESKKKKRGNKNIVHMLMNQDKYKGIGCGIGNYLCAEILYEAKINPNRDITDLTQKEIVKLGKSIRKILKKTYVNNSTNYLGHMNEFMEKHYDMIKSGRLPNYFDDIKLKDTAFQFKVYGKNYDSKNNKVIKTIIYQTRTTWWVPTVQK